MKYKREGEIILISRNKRKVLRRVKEEFGNEDGCFACSLFNVCVSYGGVCVALTKQGLISDSELVRNFVDC